MEEQHQVPTRELLYSSLPAAEKALDLAVWLEENKARDLVALDVAGVNPCMEAILVLTANSVRHARALADGLLEQCRLRHYEYLRMEGYQAGLWVLVDLNDVVVHIFQAESRELYRLEDLWPLVPRLKPLPAGEPLVETSSSPEQPADSAV